VADAWRNDRWDSFTLVTPNWTFKLPGAEYSDSEPEGFLPRWEILRRFEQYEQVNHFPVIYSTEATRVEPMDDHFRYRVVTNKKVYEAMNVVIATGLFQQVKIPAFAGQIPAEILQIPSDAYRNPQSLPYGAVLVVGSAQSGCQIAEELHESGRKVYLSTSTAGRLPRRYRGKDIVYWLSQIGFFDRTPVMLDSPRDRISGSAQATGKAGGHDINLHKFSRDGIVLLGHVHGFQDGKLVLKPDLKENLAKADAAGANVFRMIDGYILSNALSVPIEEVSILDDGFRAPVITSLDFLSEGISAIIWACGYRLTTPIQLSILDSTIYPSADNGVTLSGLYMLGMPWMNKLKSGLIMGIGESAQHLAEVICNE
jgi:putative flavoprotein involved in K+ transport